MSQPKRKQTRPRALKAYLTILKQQLPELTARYHVKSLGVFGSYVRNEQKPRSDLDILVEFSETPDLFEFMDLERHLAMSLGIKVDLVSRKALKKRIGQHILQEVVPV
jgi:hypothetical protein